MKLDAEALDASKISYRVCRSSSLGSFSEKIQRARLHDRALSVKDFYLAINYC